MEIMVKPRKWGNSLGVILPQEFVQRERIKEGTELKMLVLRRSSVLEMDFGMLKGKIHKSSQQIMKELREDLYGS